MGLFMPSFKDITMKSEYMTAHIRLSRFGWRFQKAQEWLDREIVRRMEPFVPKDTGEFLSKIKGANTETAGTGKIITSVPPQGRTLYPGVTKSGKPINWTNPNTQPYWGTYTVQTYKKELKKGVFKILMGSDDYV